MEKRRLLYCELTCVYDTPDAVKTKVCHAVAAMDIVGALEHFRENSDKPYLVWRADQYPRTVAFTLRLKTPWDIDTVFYHLNEIKGTSVSGLSWFPSREQYGGTVQSDGSVIETWDI